MAPCLGGGGLFRPFVGACVGLSVVDSLWSHENPRMGVGEVAPAYIVCPRLGRRGIVYVYDYDLFIDQDGHEIAV